jgi:hypothetical protein
MLFMAVPLLCGVATSSDLVDTVMNLVNHHKAKACGNITVNVRLRM